MISERSFFSALYLRHLERSSPMLIPAESSMISPDSPIVLAPSIIPSHSFGDTLPLLIDFESTCDYMESNLLTNCSFDISSEKIATLFLSLKQTCWAMFRANAVLPIDGLAAISTRSDGCNPAVL